MKKNGFTLVELMAVIVIIGILAAFSFPIFQDAANKSRVAKAPQVLMKIAGAQEAFRLVNGEYLPLDNTSNAANWGKLGLAIPEMNVFEYSVTVRLDPPTAGVPKFTASAKLKRDMSQTITIDQDGKKDGHPELKRLIPSFFK
jgi:prepilin-type N-terminal cleavage/methylation domain-containing protein